MLLFAALSMARLQEHMPWPLAFLLAFCVMVALAWLIERLVLRHLVNQNGVTLLMATLGIAYFLEGLGQMLWGDDIYRIDLGLPKQPTVVLSDLIPGGLLLSREDLIATLAAALLVALLSLFFQKSSVGRALRAVADDHQAAQSIGIPLSRMWVIVWVHRRPGGAGDRHDLGLQARGAILALAHRAQGPARGHSRRTHLGARSHRRRLDRRRRREAGGGLSRAHASAVFSS